MRKKKDIKKLGVNRETIAVLTPNQTAGAVGGAIWTTGGGGCQASIMVCSFMETCVSCKDDGTILAVAVKE
jgi:hypothetical protein